MAYLIWRYMVEYLKQFWSDAYESLNPGQQTIFLDYMTKALQEWFDDSLYDWPDVDADHYASLMYNAYDYEVGDRAFSDLVTESTYEVAWLIQEAQELKFVDMFR